MNNSLKQRIVRIGTLSARIVLCVSALMFASFAQADLFSGFYTSKAPAKQSLEKVTRIESREPSETTGAVCIAAIMNAQEVYDIPDNLLLAIGLQEAGRNGSAGLAVWPWTVNANGKGAFFKNRQDAQDWVREKQAAGINSIDVGCMQINLRWHGDQFPHQDAAFDPQMNADYAARFLTSLYRETGSWTKAAGRYHSATEKYQKRYLASLAKNQTVAIRQLPRLMALARSAGPLQVASTSEPVKPKAPPPPVFWAASDTGESYSIYSNAPLRPILPQFREAN